jgi:alkylation response protein AidB-like acyl-CoA dehydrogenase
MYSIYSGGCEEQRDRWLPAMAAMDRIGAFAMTEPSVVRMSRAACAPRLAATATPGC